jgi:hypothetical protein
VSKSTKCPHESAEKTSRPQREADFDPIADVLLTARSEEFPEAKEATDGDLLRGGVELALDDCRWLAVGDCKLLLSMEAALEEDLALDDKQFIIIPGMVIVKTVVRLGWLLQLIELFFCDCDERRLQFSVPTKVRYL